MARGRQREFPPPKTSPLRVPWESVTPWRAKLTEMCPLCGRVAEFIDGACSGCGAAREPEARGPRVEYRRRRRAPMFLAVGGVAAVLGIVAVAGASGDGEDHSTPVSPVTPTTTPVATPSADADCLDAYLNGDVDDYDDCKAGSTAITVGGKTYRCDDSVIGDIEAA